MLQASIRPVRRAGFTLIELLVVIAIIAVLASLTAAAVFRTIGRQQSSNTKALLTKLQGELQKDWRAAADQYATEPIPIQGSQMGNAYYGTVLPMAGGDRGRAKVIWTKLRLKQTFPMTFNEALNPTPMPALPTYQTALTALGYTTANTTTPQPWESSVLLLMALQRGMEGNGVKVEDLGVNSSLHDFTTPNGTVKGLVDAWGNPLRFCRWPTNSTILNPNGAQPGDNNDPGDPSGLLVSTTWQNTTGYHLFTSLCHPVPQHAAGTEATTYRISPLIVSAGPDGVLGLDKEPLATGMPAVLSGAQSQTAQQQALLGLANGSPPTLSLTPPAVYNFATLPANQGGANAADDLYPTLGP